jgi:Flp pilus assembly pilin Flp
MRELLARFVREDEGQDIIEYALLAALLTTGVITTIGLIGGDVLAIFTDLEALIVP